MQIDVAKCDRIVRWVACKLGATFPVADSDEYADGWIGMVKAMKKYDPDKINPESGKSYMLSTYAVRWIKAYIHARRKRRHAWGRGGTGTGSVKLHLIHTSSLHDMGDSSYENRDYDPADHREEKDYASAAEQAARLLNCLKGRRREAVEMVVMQGKTIREAAALMGVSHSRVKQLRDTGIGYLKRLLACGHIR